MNPPDQAFKLEFSDDTQFAHGYITADRMDFAGAESYITEMARKCSLLDTSGLLLERHISNPLSRALAYWKVTLMKDTLPDHMSVAIVEGDAMAREHLQWGIVNAGTGDLAIRVFGTVAEAEKWLRKVCSENGPGEEGGRPVSRPTPVRKKTRPGRGGKYLGHTPVRLWSNRFVRSPGRVTGN